MESASNLEYNRDDTIPVKNEYTRIELPRTTKELREVIDDLRGKKGHKIVIIGEENGTFAVALVAALREDNPSWDRIIVTAENAQHLDALDDFQLVIDTCIAARRMIGSSHPFPETFIRAVPPPTAQSWVEDPIDARYLHANEILESHIGDAPTILMFQAPWVVDGLTRNLIDEFMQSAAQLQAQTGGLVFLGVTRHPRYWHGYGFETLLEIEQLHGDYKFMGADRQFVFDIVQHGYKHTSCVQNVDLHVKLHKTWMFLVYERNVE